MRTEKPPPIEERHFSLKRQNSLASTSGFDARMALFLACFAMFLVVATIVTLKSEGISSLDNDSYSYIDEAQWVAQHGFTGQLRPYTGNVPKPLLVLLYGIAYHTGNSFLWINALCTVVSGCIVGLIYLIGRRLHSVPAGLFAATLTFIEWPLVEASMTANSSLFLLLFSLLAFYLSLRLRLEGKQALWVCCLLCLGGLSRPEGWLLYLVAVAGYLWVARKHPRLKSAKPLLYYALFAPLLSPLIERLCWGDWLYSLHSFQYFTKQFLSASASPIPLSYQIKAYLLTLWRLGEGGGGSLLLLLFAGVGFYRLQAMPSRKSSAKMALGVGALILFSHYNTFRQGFFAPRFVLIPLIALLMFFCVGVVDTLARGWKRIVHESDNWSLYKLIAVIPLWRISTFGMGGYLVVTAFQTTYTEAGRMRRLNHYMGVCVREIDAYPKSSARILMANAVYNPVRFNIRPKGGAHIDRMIEELDSRLSGDQQLAQYDILCVGGRNPRNVAILDAVRQQESAWEKHTVDIGEPLYLYIRKPEK